MKNHDELFKVLREVEKNPKISQRKLAENVNFSLGKINYCLNALKNKGLVKMKNFKNNKKKIGYAYILTTKGLSKKTNMAINFLKRKMKEYDEIKKEIKNG
jgi:EPS-associated MarR family transcriptional regulator